MAEKMSREEFYKKYGNGDSSSNANEDQVLTGNEKESTTEIKKCPNCGAAMIFDPEKHTLKCPYCESEEEVDFSNLSEEQDFEKLFNTNSNGWGVEAHVLRCNNCGATQIISKKDISRICPYCGTTNVVESSDIPGLKPNGVVPFNIGTDKASLSVKEWGKKRLLAPRDFKKSLEPEELNGVYSPVFTFDSDTKSSYSGRLGKRYTKHVRRNGKDVTVTETRYFNVSGYFDYFFNDIVIHASNRLTRKDLLKLGNFDTNHSQDYNQDFLFGFTAEAATRTSQECYREAKDVMDKSIRAMILRKYDYDVVDYLDVKTKHFDQTFKYVLLPLYVGHNLYRGKTYNFYVNGLTGQTTGKSPKSIIKVSILVLIILLAVAAIALLALYYLE